MTFLKQPEGKVSQCRVRALPLHSEVKSFMERHETVIVLEINRDGQLYGIMRKEMPTELLTRIHCVAYAVTGFHHEQRYMRIKFWKCSRRWVHERQTKTCGQT